MKPMDREFIEQHDIAQRYLHGRLTPEEAEEFEVYLMDNPEMVEELEFSVFFNKTLCSQPLNQPQQVSLPWFSLNRLVPTLGLTIAGCFLLFLVLPQVVMHDPVLDETQDNVKGRNQVVYLDVLRTQEGDKEIVIGRDTSQLVMFITPRPDVQGPFNVNIIGTNSGTQITDNLTALLDKTIGDIIITVPTDHFINDTYEIEWIDTSTSQKDSAVFKLIKRGE